MYKIATVTTAYNQFQDFENWIKHYNEYKDEIAYHIIIDNNSSKEYKELYKPYFKNSILLELPTGKGVTGGYNEGICYIKENLKVDFIFFIMQDMHIPKGGTTILAKCLADNKEMGVIAPVNLYENNSNIIREHGGIINKLDYSVSKQYLNYELNDRIPEMLEVDFLCGGNYMFKSEVFDKIGLFDEKIFMYGDEVDILLRASSAGYKIYSTTKTICNHEHIYQKINGKIPRFPSDHALFFTGRNYFYLIKKHGNKKGLFYGIIRGTFRLLRLTIASLIKTGKISKPYFLFKGFATGLFFYK